MQADQFSYDWKKVNNSGTVRIEIYDNKTPILVDKVDVCSEDLRKKFAAKVAEKFPGFDSGAFEGALMGIATEVGKPKSKKPRKDQAQAAEPKKERPQVEVSTRRHETLAGTLVGLANDPQLYRRGPFLVNVVKETSDTMKLTAKTIMKSLEGSPKIINLSGAVIGIRIAEFVDLYQMKTKDGEEFAVAAHPPDWLIKATETLEHWPMIRKLTSVVECPFPRPDGTIVETPGYDAATSTLYLPAGDFPSVPANPTRDDARAAWGRISHYIRQFPFASEDDKVVILAGMLNVIARVAVEGPVMGVAVNGNKAASGKGLLVYFMTLPGIGRPAPNTTYPENKEEANKVKTAIVLSGKPVVFFDNLEEGSSYGNGVMDSALTAYTIDERILGASKNTGELQVRTTWFLNGNNITPGADAYRRWMTCTIVAKEENPEHRQDIEDKELEKTILRNRGEIVRDCLTIVRAHAQAGWPNGGWSPVGSFSDWDRVIRGAVWFATDRDCLATQKKMASESPERLNKLALLEGWRELPGGKFGEAGVTVAEAIEMVGRSPELYPGLHAVFKLRMSGGKPSAKAIGNSMRALKNATLGGYTLREYGLSHNAVLWVVDKDGDTYPAGTSRGESGDSGESASGPPTRDFGSSADAIMCGGVGENCMAGQGGHSPDSPDSPSKVKVYADEEDWTNRKGVWD